jgi:hypothetical protein
MRNEQVNYPDDYNISKNRQISTEKAVKSPKFIHFYCSPVSLPGSEIISRCWIPVKSSQIQDGRLAKS